MFYIQLLYAICIAGSVGSRQHWLWDIARKRNEFLLFSNCSENPSIAHNLGTTGPIQVRFSAKCTSSSEHFNQIENWKCHIHVQVLIDPARWHHIITHFGPEPTCDSFRLIKSHSLKTAWLLHFDHSVE